MAGTTCPDSYKVTTNGDYNQYPPQVFSYLFYR